MVKGTTKFEGYEFENEDIVIDSKVFKECHFKKCKLIYYGQGPFHLGSNHFDDCRWALAGQAINVIEFLRLMYHGCGEGGRLLVEKTFQMIRTPKP
jgi:hypothetical protein